MAIYKITPKVKPAAKPVSAFRANLQRRDEIVGEVGATLGAEDAYINDDGTVYATVQDGPHKRVGASRLKEEGLDKIVAEYVKLCTERDRLQAAARRAAGVKE